MQQISVEEAQTMLPVLFETALSGEEVIIANDYSAIRLVPLARPKPRPQFGSARGLLVVPDDFNEPLEDFKEYLG